MFKKRKDRETLRNLNCVLLKATNDIKIISNDLKEIRHKQELKALRNCLNCDGRDICDRSQLLEGESFCNHWFRRDK
jgi:hypothetical protein